MVKLRKEYTFVLKQKDQLQRTAEEFYQSSKEYEESRKFIASLQSQISEANELIAKLKLYKDNLKVSQSLSLT